MRRSTFVFSLYSSRDLLKIGSKLDSEEELEAVDVLDTASARRGSGSECMGLAVSVRSG